MSMLGFECAGIYEEKPDDLARSIAAKYGIPMVSDRQALLADDIEIVGSSAIHSDKIALIELCEQYGKPIMLTKPAVINRSGYERLKQVVDRGIIQIGMMLMERMGPAEYTLKRRLEAGVLGDIVSIATRKPHRLTPKTRPPWFFDKQQNGAIINDLSVHEFDLLRWLTGKEIVASQGYMLKHILPEHPTFYDSASLQVKMESGIVAQLYLDWYTPEQSWTWGDCRIFITGTKGTAELRLSGDPLVAISPLFLITTYQEGLVSVELDTVPYTLCSDFIDRIEGRSDWVIGHADILAASLAAIQADESVTIIDRTK
ncbi:Gfo/Idh/MocA family oxidoreductase [Paenibacillus sp. S3N08]|uniref:Gfo/Idh/MocA family oxidoreductase n=2 Tax=Paenibacillus agricola TaxID=2716264 RepID=A0ABX0JFH1_9BACL|nr:Gfo/Idh/MocA family oxidoreductase [Paenibacillus agricola]